MKNVRMILVGFGTVGRGIAKVMELKKNKFAIFNINPRIVAICEYNGCIINDAGIPTQGVLKLAEERRLESHKDWKNLKSLEVIKETEADIVIEVTPTSLETGEPGTSHMKAALESGKHLVTSNKGPLALHFKELNDLARKKNVEFRYEATVCGGMPTFNLVRKTLALNSIESIQGILNGTTNYILTKMHNSNLSFEVALREAKEMGIAEANYRYDIEAIDPAAKLVILANAIMGKNVKFSDVKRVGIDKITTEAVQLAKKKNFVIKLIGEISKDRLEVVPRLVPSIHPLNVPDTLNALLFKTDLAREVLVVGRGAGQLETTSAIFSDIIDICTSVS